MASLEERVAKLEQQIRGGLNLGPQQKGPLPGWFRAAHIEGNQMLINMTDSKVGISPRISVTDTTGTTRAELGNLASYTGPNGTVSPAQYGFRASDQSGNPIFDSLGLISTMSQITVVRDVNPDTIGPGASPTIVPGVTATYVATRQPTSTLVIVTSTALTSGGVGNYSSGAIYIDGSPVGTFSLWDRLNPGYTCTVLMSHSTLTPGSHTWDYRINNDAGQTWLNFVTEMRLFLLGS